MVRAASVWTASVGVLAGGAMAQPVGAENLRAFWTAAPQRRVDVVHLGDSTQVFGGHGWDEGWARALNERYGLFATGIHSAGENAGNGLGVGWLSQTISTRSQGQFQYSGAPAEADSTCYAGLIPLGYLYVPAGASVQGSVNSGLHLEAASPLGVNGKLRFHYCYARFDTRTPGTFRPVVRLNASPFTNLSTPVDVSTGGGDSLEAGFIDLLPAVRDAPIGFRWSQSGGPEIAGPFFGSWMRAERVDRLTGASVSTLYAAGGHSTRDVAAALLAAPDATLGSYFSMLRSMQPSPVRVLFRVSFGANDRNEPLPSVGPGGYLPGWSTAAFEENTRAVIRRIEQVWTQQGWDVNEIFFVLTVSPPVSDLEDEFLPGYRDVTDSIAASLPRVASVRFDRLTSEAEMLANGWYYTPTDHLHFSQPGFVALSDREVATLLTGATTMGMRWRTVDGGGVTVSSAGSLEMAATIAQPDAAVLAGGGMVWHGGFWGEEATPPPCPADYNQDGGIDGADVEAFFVEWESSMPRADVNGDGGIDGADVETFFGEWEAGGC